MGTDADDVQILGHFLTDFIHGGDFPETLTQPWKNKILKDCKQIAQRIPQPIRDVIRIKIRTRQDNDPVTQVPESFCQPDSINTQILQTPGEISQFAGSGISSTIASPTTGPERVSEECVSNSLSPEQSSAQNAAPTEGTSKQEDSSTFILVRHIESWASSPEEFLNVAGINVACGISGYIQALKATQHLNPIRMRFALLQLYKSKKAWRQTIQSFLARLKIGRRTFNSWVCEGENYFSLVEEKGLEVLFAKLKSRTQCRNPAKTIPPRGKKRPIDDLDTNKGCDSETNIGKHHGKVKTKCLTFTSEEVKLPKLYVEDESGEFFECREDHGKVRELYKTAADRIMACLEEVHREAGLLIGDGSQDSRSAGDLEISNNPTSYVGQELVKNPMGRVADDGRNDGSGPQNAAVGIRDDQFDRVTSGGTATSSLEPTPVRNLTEDASPSDNQGLSLDLGNSECSRVTSTDYNAMAATPSTRNRQPYTGHAGSGTDQELPQIVSRYGECQQLGLSPGAFQDRDQNVVAGVEHGGCAGDIDEWTKLFPNVIGIDEFGSDQWFRVQ